MGRGGLVSHSPQSGNSSAAALIIKTRSRPHPARVVLRAPECSVYRSIVHEMRLARRFHTCWWWLRIALDLQPARHPNLTLTLCLLHVFANAVLALPEPPHACFFFFSPPSQTLLFVSLLPDQGALLESVSRPPSPVGVCSLSLPFAAVTVAAGTC